jgi:Zn-finger nucleic acid-binding protein
MRLLVACPQCHRQYDASQRQIGSRFRCHCGQVIMVQQPLGHEARVVRCSSCGAALPDNASRCPFCQSEITLHDRDLDTVCPHCLALVSDQARFCHHCGTGLVPELDAGRNTELLCPACQDGHRLVSRYLGAQAVTVLECGRCAGFWLGHEAFRQLVERAQKEALPAGTTVKLPAQAAVEALPGTETAPEGGHRVSFYRPCPVCHELMPRLNYGHCGVIIDVCRHHGIWFDANELARILAWLHAGGVAPSRDVPRPRQGPGTESPHVERESASFLEKLLGTLLGQENGM